MRKLAVFLLVLVVGFVAGRLSHQRVEAQAVPDCATENGEINGDGSRDISDAVALLGFLFLGKDPPVPLCTPSGGSGLPDTGQTKCNDAEGNEIPCDSATCAGQDGLYATGCSPEGRFVDNGDGTVTDTCTGLMWQKDTGNNEEELLRCNALSYCEDLELGGHADWRLPNVREMHSIVDYGRRGPARDPVFGALVSDFYWSSTSYLSASDINNFAWLVTSGNVFHGDKTRRMLVRAVRSGP